MHYPQHLQKLIEILKKLPGVGAKSAERFAFQLLSWPGEKLQEMACIIGETPQRLSHCDQCGCLIETACPLCSSPTRSPHLMCVVASSKDIFLIEQTHAFKGLYHALGGLLSPLKDEAPTQEAIEKLKIRAQTLGVKEMILALDSTLEGDATALLLKKEMENSGVTLSRLALGLPMGSSLDFIDGGTLARALAGRNIY